MTKRDDLTEEERKQIKNEFQKWGKWMTAIILFLVGMLVYDANTAQAQNVPPNIADNIRQCCLN